MSEVPFLVTTSAKGPDRKIRYSLKARSIHGIAWSIGGHGFGEVIRLAANLILTRLLIPEDFGLMLMVNVFLMGLKLFSDVGIGPSIIQNARGEDPKFLNTAWTIQVIRGTVLWLIAALLAYPFALFYGMPRLAELLPVAAITAFVSGFNSTHLFTLNRHLLLGKITLLESGQTLVAVAVMITWACLSPSVWALVAGGIAGSLFRAVFSHYLLSGPSNRFAWNHEASRELFHFGRWILLSTMIGFFASRGDRLILGQVMTEAELGMLSIALVLSYNLVKLISDIGRKVLFPLFVRLAERGPGQLRSRVAWMRASLMLLALPPLCCLAVFGDAIVVLLWDSRYEGAGWMLQILAAGGVFSVINNTSLPVLLAVGDSLRHLGSTVARALILALAMLLGSWWAGTVGCVLGAAITPLLNYPVLAWLIHRHGVWLPGLDLLAALASVSLIGLGLVVKGGM